MRKALQTLFLFTLLSSSLIFMSALPAPSSIDKPTKLESANMALQKANADGNISYRELKDIATDLKGSKLTLKEKIALKIFNKRISSKQMAGSGGKSQVIALILCALLGGLGIHRFYLGYTWQGIVQLLTLGGCGIWALIDLVRIITGDLQPKDDSYETTL